MGPEDILSKATASEQVGEVCSAHPHDSESATGVPGSRGSPGTLLTQLPLIGWSGVGGVT